MLWKLMSKCPECFQNIAQHMVDATDDDSDDDDNDDDDFL